MHRNCRSEPSSMDLEERAEKAEIAGDFQAALGLWREVAAKEHDAAFFCRYGRVAQRLGKWEEAESAFAEALRLEPNLSEAMESLGDLWITRSDKDRVESLATARDWFVKALTRDRNARALTFLGNAYNELSDLDKARAAFEEAIQIDSNYEEALYNLALLE